MDPVREGEPAASTVTGPAVIGHDPEQVLCWKPCCRQPVRFDAAQLDRWLPVAVACEGPRCRRLWTVEFPQIPPWEEQVAVWRPQTRGPQR